MFAPFWPPNVVLLCTPLVVPPRKWWLFIAAVFPAHAVAELGVGMPVSQLIAAFGCNVALALLNAAGLRYFISGPVWLGSLRNVTIYVLIAVLFAPGLVALAAGLEHDRRRPARPVSDLLVALVSEQRPRKSHSYPCVPGVGRT